MSSFPYISIHYSAIHLFVFCYSWWIIIYLTSIEGNTGRTGPQVFRHRKYRERSGYGNDCPVLYTGDVR